MPAINLDEEFFKEFEKTARARYGDKHGILKRAATEALSDWMKKVNGE